MPRHSCRGALFWSFRYGYATLLESWRHSLPHVQPADPAGRRCRVAVLPPAAQSPGRKPRPDRASLSLWGSGGIGRRKISLPAAPAAPAAPGPPPAADPAAFSALYLSGGFVFYGGLFGALAAVWLFCRRRKVPFSQLGADLVPAVPLFHTFGRVGCFLAGCCYGIPAPAGWPGVTFRVSPVAPNGVALLPVQLYEAAGCLLLFLLLHRLARRGWKGEVLLLVYLAIYALFRFALEFLRGDAARGMWGVFSTSQLLALVTLAAVLPLLIRHLRTYGKQPRL